VPLLLLYANGPRSSGWLNLNLGDEAHVRGLAFCGRSADVTLIPDPDFFKTFGYRRLAQTFADSDLPWNARRSVALWRGSSTGYRAGQSVKELERVKLCLHAASGDAAQLVDAGLTNLVQVTTEERLELEALQIVKDHVSAERLREWKYHIDIDGNSNSWSGLFQKLLSGSVVLKVDSSGNWRQWYYDQLEPFKNFVPVAADLSDLTNKLKYLRYNDTAAEEIGRNGRALALSLSYETQITRALDLIERAIVIEMVS
jgi:hypothetical protein